MCWKVWLFSMATDQSIAVPHIVSGANSVRIPNAQSLDKLFLVVVLDVLRQEDVFSMIYMLYSVDRHSGKTPLGKVMFSVRPFPVRPVRASGPIRARIPELPSVAVPDTGYASAPRSSARACRAIIRFSSVLMT